MPTTKDQLDLLENWEKDFKTMFHAIKQAIKRDSTHLEQSGADDWFIEKVKKIQLAQEAKTREECAGILGRMDSNVFMPVGGFSNKEWIPLKEAQQQILALNNKKDE